MAILVVSDKIWHYLRWFACGVAAKGGGRTGCPPERMQSETVVQRDDPATRSESPRGSMERESTSARHGIQLVQTGATLAKQLGDDQALDVAGGQARDAGHPGPDVADDPDLEVADDTEPELAVDPDADFEYHPGLDFEDELEEEFEDDPDPGVEQVWTGQDPASFVPAPGCAVSFFADNKRHHALCLAVLGDELLLEQKGASQCYLFIGKVLQVVPRLRFGVVSATVTVGALKACRYRSLPKRWLQEMVKTGRTWKGLEGGGKVAPPPAELLKGQMELF